MPRVKNSFPQSLCLFGKILTINSDSPWKVDIKWHIKHENRSLIDQVKKKTFGYFLYYLISVRSNLGGPRTLKNELFYKIWCFPINLDTKLWENDKRVGKIQNYFFPTFLFRAILRTPTSEAHGGPRRPKIKNPALLSNLWD